MPLYANIDGAKREVKELYANIGGAKKMLSEMNGNIDGAKKKIFSRYYTWAKYVSYRTGSAYRPYTQTSDEINSYLWIWEPREYPGIVEFEHESVDGYKYYIFTYGTGFSYSSSSGTFSLTGVETDSLSTLMSTSNYEIEKKYIGKYVYNTDDNRVYKITGHDDVNTLHLGYMCTRGSIYYKYQYKYDSDVESTDPNAYTSGSTSGYTSDSSSDIRTVYVKK